MVESESRVEVPIEISPPDLREIKQLLERIERGESKLSKMQNEADVKLPEGGSGPSDITRSSMSEDSHTDTRKRKRGFKKPELPEGGETAEESTGEETLAEAAFLSSVGAPIQRGGGRPTGPIFRGVEESPDVVKLARSGKSNQPFQRMDAFANLKNKVDDLEEEVKKTKESPLESSDVSKGAGMATSLISGPGGFFMSMITKLAPYIAPILVAKGLLDTIIGELTKPGGLFDRRFKLNIQNQVVESANRQQLQLIRAGLTEVRVTTTTPLVGQRGLVSNNLNLFQRGGKPVYDLNLENYAKGGTQ